MSPMLVVTTVGGNICKLKFMGLLGKMFAELPVMSKTAGASAEKFGRKGPTCAADFGSAAAAGPGEALLGLF